jgi:hypothetical protein
VREELAGSSGTVLNSFLYHDNEAKLQAGLSAAEK